MMGIVVRRKNNSISFWNLFLFINSVVILWNDNLGGNVNNNEENGIVKRNRKNTAFLMVAAEPRKAKGSVEENLVFALRGQVPDFRPRAVVDIGANRGKYSSFVHRMYPEAPIFLIEADAMHEEKLSSFVKDKEKLDYKIIVLSAADDEEVSWYGSGNTGNSMFRERSAVYEDATPVSKKAMTLDSVLREYWTEHHDRVDLIKVDVQGAELVVLKGAQRTLAGATFLQIEASTVAYNEGGSCTWQVDAYLRSQGYALYDLGEKQYYYPLFQTPGLGQYDVLYINTKNLPDRVQNASFCAGVDNNYNNDNNNDDNAGEPSLFETSLMELEDMVGMDITSSSSSSSNSENNTTTFITQPCIQQQQSRRRRRGGGALLFGAGILFGYVLCYFQTRGFFRRRRIQRED